MRGEMWMMEQPGKSRMMCRLWIALALLSLSCVHVIGLPIPIPNLKECSPIRVRDDLVVDCCIPADVPIKDFQFPDPSEPKRIRKNAVSLDAASIEKYNQAYLKMRALPPTDGRSMTVQQNIHCGYCTEVYKQMNSTKTLEVHRNWILLPFHRWYVYFHEKILGSLIDDPTFAIPYWNWDNQSAVHTPSPNAIPEYFYSQPGLHDENRNPNHAPPNIADLHWGPFFGTSVPDGTSVEDLRFLNNIFMYEALVSGSTLAELFLGGFYRFGEDLPYSPGLFEIGPHAAIHGWVGNQVAMPKGEDMEPSYSAARDPVFFAHHSNVDRIFEAWRGIGGGRLLPTDPDWLDASFLFYDEKAELVRVTVRQALEIDRLQYEFEETDTNGWINDLSTPVSDPTASIPGMKYRLSKAAAAACSWLGFDANTSNRVSELLADIPDIESVREKKFSSRAFHSRIARPHASLLLKANGKQDEFEEVLAIEGIWVPTKKPIWFEIYINVPSADEKTSLTATEWCGRFSNGPHLDRVGHMEREAVFKISIGQKLKKLGIVDRESLVVSLVPKGEPGQMPEVQIRNIKVELRSLRGI